MKLIVFLLTVIALQVTAKGNAQIVTFSGKEVSLKEIFSVIKQQTGYVVLFDYEVINKSKPVTVAASNQPLSDFLTKVLTGQQLDFSIHKKTIFIKKAPTTTVIDNTPTMVAQADPKPVRGIVRSANGDPLMNVNVILKGTVKGVTTDFDGSFNIKASVGDILIVSSIGYQTATFKIPAANNFVIILSPSAEKLGDVQVTVNTGYQRIRPEQSTGSVSQISTKDYESRVSTSFLDGLVNKLPGLMINNDVTFTSNVNGTKSSRSLFTIRGISTMAGNASPLIVIDGYPTELTLDMIDPNEIKSVTILKDAAAATIYGVRASNGVIVIERKQAAAGKARFAFRATAGMSPKTDYSRYRWADDASAIVTDYERTVYNTSIDASRWTQIITQSSNNGAQAPVSYLIAQQKANIITPAQAEKSFADMAGYNNAEDYSKLFLQSKLTHTYNLSISGGNPNALYYITANYTGNRGEQIRNNNDRFLLSGRSTLKLSERLSLELTTDYQEQHFKSAPVPAITSVYPYEHFQDASGAPLSITSGSGINPYYNDVIMAKGLLNNLYYPLVDVHEVNDKTHTINNRITAKFNYKIGHGFDLSFGGIYETSRSDIQHNASEQSSEAKQYINSYVTQNADGSLVFNLPKGGFLRQEVDNTVSYTLRTQLNYNKRLGSDHSINAILGAEVRDVIEKGNTASYFGYNDQSLLQQPVNYQGIFNSTITSPFIGTRTLTSLGNDYYFGQAYQEDRYLSGYANVVYSFKNTYSLTGSARIDQSNLFGTNPKYKYKPFWSVGAAWNIYKEDFMQDIGWVKMLKLRVAEGFNGNVAKNSLPQAIAQYVLNNNTSPASPALTKYSYANSSLRWEQTKNFNIGLDYQVFRNISGSIDYYRKTSTDLLGNALIDPTIGASPSLINIAAITNNGIEVSLHADWISTKKVNWNTGLVLSRNTSKTTQVYQNVSTSYNPENLNALGYVKGFPVGATFAYRDAGLDTSGYALLTNTRGELYTTKGSSLSSQVTKLMYSDTSGFVRYMGTTIPSINVGVSNRVDVGNWYLYCMINYYGGFKVRAPRANPAASRPLAGAGNYWKQAGDEATTDVMALGAYAAGYSLTAYNYSDKYVVRGDYLTVGDVTVSYSLDKAPFIQKAGFSHFEVKLQASNIYTVGLNKYNYSLATGSYEKSYITPTYTIGIFTNF
jgi:TonB-linked SusC/RagA family outer membrane protein